MRKTTAHVGDRHSEWRILLPGITQIIAGGALLAPLLGVEKWIADLDRSAIIFMAIITAGGLRSIALVNVIQMGVIFVGMCRQSRSFRYR